MNNIEIGNRLVKLRREYGKLHGEKQYNQEKFAYKIGLVFGTDAAAQNRISQIENGKSPITVEELARYAECCGVSMEWILTGEEKAAPETPTAEYSASDFCRLIYKLDEKGLCVIDYSPENTDKISISFPSSNKNETGKTIYNRYGRKLNADFCEDVNNFLRHYCFAFSRITVDSSPIKDWDLAQNLVEAYLNTMKSNEKYGDFSKVVFNRAADDDYYDNKEHENAENATDDYYDTLM